MINIALPKGRLGEKVYALLSGAGYSCSDYDKNARKLVFESNNGAVSYFWVKPADVAVYVEMGAADLGIVGKDVIDENKPDIYEILDTGFGKCKMCVAAKSDWHDCGEKLRVATKFPNIAREYYSGLGRDIDVIKLNGSIELAPLLGLSDVIVDIVETGITLRENNLKVYAEIFSITARLVANKSAYNFKFSETMSIKQKFEEALK